jgi:hypothetical protein
LAFGLASGHNAESPSTLVTADVRSNVFIRFVSLLIKYENEPNGNTQSVTFPNAKQSLLGVVLTCSTESRPIVDRKFNFKSASSSSARHLFV